MVQVSKNPIHFHFQAPAFFFPHRSRLKLFLLQLFKREEKNVEAINYIFCTDDYLLSLNKTHLKHDTYTDIITFELSRKGEPLLSDIFISVDRVRENAETFQTGFQKELHRVIFHGALHLCNYKDKTTAQTQQMRHMEELYLGEYFVPRGTGRRKL